jgi:hypothetical protein
MPTPEDVNPTKTTLMSLSIEEKETYKLLLLVYKEDLAVAK